MKEINKKTWRYIKKVKCQKCNQVVNLYYSWKYWCYRVYCLKHDRIYNYDEGFNTFIFNKNQDSLKQEKLQ